MVILYIVILCVSALFCAWAAARVTQRLKSLLNLHIDIPSGLYALISSITFLTVVGVPAMALVGTLLLLGSALLADKGYLPPIARFGIPALAVILGMATFKVAPIGQFPMVGILLVIAIMLYLQCLSGDMAPNTLRAGTLSIAAPLAPLLLAPLLFHTPTYIALDAALILSALAGILLIRPLEGAFGPARTPFAFLLGWLMVEAALQGAWPVALISTLAWFGAIAYATVHSQDAGPHALRF